MRRSNLKVLIAHHRWWYPIAVSGADLANHEFARKLMARGVDVRVQGIAHPAMGGRIKQREYHAEGVPVCLVTSDFLQRLRADIRAFQPDVVFTSCPEPNCGEDDITRMIEICRGADCPVVLYVHDIEGTLPLFEASKDQLARVVTNSQFMAERIQALWWRSCDVVYPIPDLDSRELDSSHGPFITFFNPLPHKGLHIAEALVQSHCTGRPFMFVEGFIDIEQHGIALSRNGNLVHARRSPDVETIYAMSSIVIIPSQWEEPFGRIAVEAMLCGVPVIASRTGGLLESVGEGGILIEEFGDVGRWAEAIELLDDANERRRLVRAGRQYVKRFSLDREIDKLLDILESVSRH